MNGLLLLLTAVVVNACVLGIAFLAVYQSNKAVKPSGR
jgi:multisubunit Na+/H+ antiporter MnhC subunit